MPHVEAISDLHGQLPAASDIPACDVLIIAGDVAPDFDPDGPRGAYDKGEVKQAAWLGTTFAEWLESLAAEYIVGIAGNHDVAFEALPGLAESLPWLYLQDDLATVAGLRIYGTPWCPSRVPNRWAFYANEKRLRYIFEAVPDSLDVLISHSPPRGYGDIVPVHSRYNITTEPVSAGTAQLTNILYSQAPRAVVCGHIHEGRGRYEYHSKGVTVYNAAYINDERVPHPGAACTYLDVLE